LLELCRYVVLNPVRAGLVRRRGMEMEQLSGTVGRGKDLLFEIDWVLSQFGAVRKGQEGVSAICIGRDQESRRGNR